MNQRELLWTTLREPAAAVQWTLAEWDLLVRQARRARVLGRLAARWQELGVLPKLPRQVLPHLDSARVVAAKHESTLRWEVACVRRALGSIEEPVILLKGAAYVMAELPPARGRLVSDLDLMVPKAVLSRVEQTLLQQGWQPLKVHPYDQRYYREWMHELPPLQHSTRGTVLDLHHTILPETGRLHPDPEKLLAASIPLDDRPFRVLSPTDMVLHSAAHLFQDGDLGAGIRDLADLDDLLRYFGHQASFWEELVPRARELDLGRPLFYALRFTRRLLDTPIPEESMAAAAAAGPGWPIRATMDALVSRALAPNTAGSGAAATSFSRWLLYVRSHWLKMPPGLLASHLTHKALQRWGAADNAPRTGQPEL